MQALKWIGIGVAGLIFLILLFIAVEDWRGESAWEQCQREAKANGLHMEWESCVPPAVPDDQNFFKAPKMQEWFQKPDPDNDSHTELWPFTTNREATISITNRVQAENYLSWSDRFSSQFDLIRAGLKRTSARMDGDYSGPLKLPRPNLGAFHSVSLALAARAKCDLILGKSDEALAELTLVNELRQVLDFRPSGRPTTLIVAMCDDIETADQFVATIADGQRSHAWTDQQLASLQLQLQQVNLPQRLKDAIRTEVPWNYYLFETNIIPQLGRRRLLQGWILQNLVMLTRFNEQAIGAADFSRDTILPSKLDDYERQRNEFYKQHVSPGNFLAMSGIPDYNDIWQTSAYDQTLVNECEIVCALERYHLAHNGYPQTLEALMPQFIKTIPHDIIGGQPLHYRRANGGKFLLYSVGWNQSDDGGLESPKDENGSIEYTNGDWVWGN